MNKTLLVKKLYETYPYPNFNNRVKTHFSDLEIVNKRFGNIKIDYLDVGCGTGDGTIGMALNFPKWKVSGIDLSSKSIEIAKKNADSRNVKISFHCQDILQSGIIDSKFDLITSFGTIHHTEDPQKAIKNLSALIKDNGIIVIHLYGKEQDREKFILKELLDIFHPDLQDIENRFKVYKVVNKLFRKNILDYSINDLVYNMRNILKKLRVKLNGFEPVPKWNEKYHTPNNHWIDHFCHPCEQAYDVNSLKELIQNSGLEILQMLNLKGEKMVPEALKDGYDKLDFWQKWRVEELIMKNKKSILFTAKKVN